MVPEQELQAIEQQLVSTKELLGFGPLVDSIPAEIRAATWVSNSGRLRIKLDDCSRLGLKPNQSGRDAAHKNPLTDLGNVLVANLGWSELDVERCEKYLRQGPSQERVEQLERRREEIKKLLSVPHYKTRRKMPEGSAILTSDFEPLPNAEFIGTFGKYHLLVYNANELTRVQTKTGWKRERRRVRKGEQPVGTRSIYGDSYYVFAEWQTEPMRERYQPRPAEDLGDDDILRALWTVNRYAKRCRDAASAHYSHGNHGFAGHARQKKEDAYRRKSLVLAVCLRLNLVECVGITDGEPSFAVFRGGGYCFHSPKGNWAAPEKELEFDGMVEAKPKEAAEMRLKDAEATIDGFFARNEPADEEIELANAAQLPPRPRRTRRYDFDDGYWEEEDDYWDDEQELEYVP